MHKLILSIFLIASVHLSAQEVIATSGDYFSNSNGSVAFTIGEVVTETITSGSSSLTQGFHQNNLTVASVGGYDNLQVQLHPNPTREILHLDISNFNGLLYKVFDVTGRLIHQKSIIASRTKIDVSSYAKGLYLVALFNQENQKLKAYRIIKN